MLGTLLFNDGGVSWVVGEESERKGLEFKELERKVLGGMVEQLSHKVRRVRPGGGRGHWAFLTWI